MLARIKEDKAELYVWRERDGVYSITKDRPPVDVTSFVSFKGSLKEKFDAIERYIRDHTDTAADDHFMDGR